MRKLWIIAAAMQLGACATASLEIDKEAIDDFIVAARPEAVDRVRTDSHDGYRRLNEYFVIYNTRRGSYLFEFVRRCRELETNRVTPDDRWQDSIRARFDTLRGCRIRAIYGLTDAQAEELLELTDAPGSRN